MKTRENEQDLDDINKQDFGKYLTLIEAFIFHTETIARRYKIMKKQIRKRRLAHWCLFTFYVATTIAAPLLLLALLLGTVSMEETLVYVVWFTLGVYLFQFQIVGVLAVHNKSKEDLKYLELGYLYSLDCIYDVVNTFFNKSDEFDTPTEIIEEEAFLKIRDWVIELETDITLFKELVYKNDYLNSEPLILNKEKYLSQREHSKAFILDYLLKKKQKA